MSASLDTSSVIQLPSGADAKFLRSVADQLEQLRSESEFRGHPLLASLLAITKGEAEDGLKPRMRWHVQAQDESAARMAQKLARTARPG